MASVKIGAFGGDIIRGLAYKLSGHENHIARALFISVSLVFIHKDQQTVCLQKPQGNSLKEFYLRQAHQTGRWVAYPALNSHLSNVLRVKYGN